MNGAVVGAAGSGIGGAAVLSSILLLAGCASDTATVSPPAATAPPTPTATIGLSVAITAVATPAPHPSATPTATRFVPPAGPWMYLAPDHGPPASRSITVVAGNLPARSPVTVSWGPLKHGAPLAMNVLTGPNGNLRTAFSVPAAPPGTYRVSIASQGLLLRTAVYHVVSRAEIRVAVKPTLSGDVITVSGFQFLARTQLSLVAYPLFRGPRPLVLGTPRSDASGRFVLTLTTRKIVPGEYEVGAYSVGTLAAQVAVTYFEVTV